MKPWSLARLASTLAVSLAIWALVAGACLLVGATGSFGIPGSITLRWRLEVVLLASLVGAALAASGVAYQAVLRNPLSDPYLLGVSSGAMLASYLWQFPAATPWLSLGGGFAVGQQVAAFAGALASVAVVFAVANRRGRLDPVTLLLVGVIVNSLNGAIFLLINSIVKDPATPGGPLTLLVGGLQTNLTTWQAGTAAAVIAAGWSILLWLSGRLNVAMVSDIEATSLGVRIQRLRWATLLTASLMTASAVAISGPIGFVGLVCPHLARLVVGNDQRRLLPLATALGASLLAFADAVSRVLTRESAAGTALPVGVLTGLIGGPFFLLLLVRSRRTAG